jgi:hypothetical protein
MRERTSIEVIFILCVVSIVALTRYVFIPLRLRRTQWLAMDAEAQPIDPAQRQPERVENYLKRVADALGPEGFEVLGDYALANFTERVAGINRILVNRATRTFASVIVNFLKNKAGAWDINQTVIAFRTDFADGSQLVTSNFKLINAVPPKPQLRTCRFVRVRNPQVLAEIHDAILERYYEGIRRELPLDTRFGGDATAFVRSQLPEELERYVASGYYYEDQADRRLRLTLRGAFLTAWKNSSPWKGLRYQKRDREAARLLKELAMDYQGRKRREEFEG